MIALSLSVITAVSVFAGLDLTVFAAGGSPINITVTVVKEGFPAEIESEIDLESVKFSYKYDQKSLLDHPDSESKTEDIALKKNADGTYSGSKTLYELVSTSYNTCYISKSLSGDGWSSSARSDSKIYAETMNFTLTFKYVEDKPRITPNWESGKLYCFDKISTTTVGSVRYDTEKGSVPSLGSVSLYANGGPVENIVGTKDNYKTKQLTLIEEFDGEDGGTFDSTKSKQIAWIVTKDDKCPTEMKQKSDNSVVKVSKGKITAIASGEAYVWACRVDPNDPEKKKVSTTESARTRVYVYDAPGKTVLTLRETIGEEYPVPVRKIDLGIGEVSQIYIYMESNGEKLDYSKWRISVTKGSEYVGVSSSGYGDSFSSSFTESFKGEDVGSFFVKAQNMNMNGKPTKAVVTATNLYTGKKMTLNITVDNFVVSVTQPLRGDPALSELIVPSPLTKTSYPVPNGVLRNYYKTSAQANLIKKDEAGNDVIPKKFETIIRSLPSDKPQIIVTSDENVTRDMIFKETKGGLTVQYTGTRSKTVTASWDMGYLKVNVNKLAAAEKGNIIIIFNKSHDMNGVLIVPYQVTSADPTNVTDTPKS